MNYVDVKVTIWNRLQFSEATNMEEVIRAIQENGIDATHDDNLGFMQTIPLFDTEEFLPPVENGAATIEVYENGKLKWTNDKIAQFSIQ